MFLSNMQDRSRKESPPSAQQQVALNFNLELQDDRQVEPKTLSLYPFVNDPLSVDMTFQVATVPEVHFSFHKHTLNIGIVFFNHSKEPFMYRLKLFDESGNICFQKDNRVGISQNYRTNELIQKPLGREYKKCKLTGIFELANFENGSNWHRYITVRRDLFPVIAQGAIQNINFRFKDCDVKATNCVVAGRGNTFGNIDIQNVVQQQSQQPQPQQLQRQLNQQLQQQELEQEHYRIRILTILQAQQQQIREYAPKLSSTHTYSYSQLLIRETPILP